MYIIKRVEICFVEAVHTAGREMFPHAGRMPRMKKAPLNCYYGVRKNTDAVCPWASTPTCSYFFCSTT